MRRKLFLLALTACSVPDKRPTGDGGVDTTSGGPIDTMITDAPSQFSNSATATFEFTSNVASAHFQCRVDARPAEACTSPFSVHLDDGSHSFAVRAVDGAGDGDDTPAEQLWTIDTVAPDTMLTETPPAADNSTTVHFAFMSSEQNVTFECSLDNAPYAPCRSGDVVGPIGDGTHGFAVRASDRAGNVDQSPAIFTWAVDTSTPDTQLASGPSGATASATATFEFYSPDAGAGATFQCSLDASQFVTCASPQTYNNLSEAVHTFAVRVRDSVGNLDPTPATRTWSVDLTAPQTTITSGPSGVVGIASASFTFTASELNVTFSCSLDGAAFAECTSPFSATMLGQGAHSFAVAAVDAAGHVDASPATASWTVDTVAPDLMIVSGPNDGDTVGPRVTFMFTVSEGTTECAIDGAAFAPCANPVSFNLPAAAHVFSVRATDAAGNATTLTRSFTVACAAPTTAAAAGLLHLDDTGQILANATGGANAVLGTTDQVEAVDPAPTVGRFGGALAFNASQSDLVSWPIGLSSTSSNFAIELWAAPEALSGTRDVMISGDGGIAIRVTAASATTVRFSATVVGSGGVQHTVTSAPVAAGSWHWVLATLQEPTLRLWVDGAVTQIADAQLSLVPALASVRLGGNYGGGLDEVWLSQAAITTDEGALERYCPL